MADGDEHKIIAKGDVGMCKDVQFVEGLHTDLISVAKLCDSGTNVLC